MTKTENENVLDGIRCPECGSIDSFRIEVTITGVATMTDDGYGMEDLDIDNTEWDNDSYCSCVTCNHRGVVAGFQIEEEA